MIQKLIMFAQTHIKKPSDMLKCFGPNGAQYGWQSIFYGLIWGFDTEKLILLCVEYIFTDLSV